MKRYFAYTRVSTMRQGENGVSLQEQTSEIERYAQQKSLYIGEWIEDRETAAKRGRIVFDRMMKRLRKGEADGVIIHKIDRSARNLRDWVDIGQLTDDGIEVHFTREAVDMQSSSGRLAADVQAVVAANYIRNLREETIKGFYGRLKQGITPLPAPIGYLDAGGGKPKTIDPLRGPLVRKAFQLYATGHYSHTALRDKMVRLGLTSKRGEPVSKTTLADALGNPFYFGLIRIEKNNQTFAGIHEPLISRELFEKVRDVAEGRSPRSDPPEKTPYLFSRMFRCGNCGRSPIAEVQKHHVYYRCHSRQCKGFSMREEQIDIAIAECLEGLTLSKEDLAELDRYAEVKRSSSNEIQRNQLAACELKLASLSQRLNRLVDAFVEGHLSDEMMVHRKETLLAERLGIEGQIRELKQDSSHALDRMEEFVELAKHAYLLYKSGSPVEKRLMIEKTLSNRELDGNRLRLSLRSELFAISNRHGGPLCHTHRTSLQAWVDSLVLNEARLEPKTEGSSGKDGGFLLS